MKKIKNAAVFAACCLLLVWAVTLIGLMFPSIQQCGIIPRDVSVGSLLGILFTPFIHKDFFHIISNSIPLFVLITTLMVSYRKLAFRVLLLSILIGGLLVWICGREGTVVIGASGLIFALIGFLLSNVFFRKNWSSLGIAIFVGLFYGTTIFGIFPGGDPNISWEAHLFGFLAGIGLAYFYRKSPTT
jgi:membrane associated rhomboid family serine protease